MQLWVCWYVFKRSGSHVEFFKAPGRDSSCSAGVFGGRGGRPLPWGPQLLKLVRAGLLSNSGCVCYLLLLQVTRAFSGACTAGLLQHREGAESALRKQLPPLIMTQGCCFKDAVPSPAVTVPSYFCPACRLWWLSPSL